MPGNILDSLCELYFTFFRRGTLPLCRNSLEGTSRLDGESQVVLPEIHELQVGL